MKVTQPVALAVAALVLAISPGLVTQDASPDEMVASLKANIQESQKRLRKYQWIETTVISLKGEEKSRKQEQVYYGADGTLTKIPMGSGPPQPQATSGRDGRLKERIVEKKKDEMQDYMEQATKLIRLYVPPSPDRIQQAKDAGHVLLRPPNQGQVRVEFQDFVQPGDLLAIDVDAKARQLTAVSVKTYLDKPEDVVTLAVRYDKLTDGTNYVAQTTLNAEAKHITVVVQNTGYKPLAAQ